MPPPSNAGNLFDERAKTWDELPRRVQLADDLFAAIERQIPLRPDMAAIDYGCGTGLLSLALAPRVRRLVAVDSSPGMLDVLSKKTAARGLANVEQFPSDFSNGPVPPGSFDLVASAMTLHHVADVRGLLRIFFSLLGRGGRIALADLDAEDGTFHSGQDGVHHLGFGRDGFAAWLAEVGFADIRLATAAHVAKSRDYSVFLATAQKP
ncbi:MAG: class I SAM-dependent methyltransferase [Kiritimatiellia bacterium]